jgi:hypothetical protein
VGAVDDTHPALSQSLEELIAAYGVHGVQNLNPALAGQPGRERREELNDNSVTLRSQARHGTCTDPHWDGY